MAQERSAAKYPVKKNDMVMVITGRERGKTGKVLKVIPASGRVIIERLNIVKAGLNYRFDWWSSPLVAR